MTTFPPISIRELSMLVDVDRDAIRKTISTDNIQPCAKGPRGHHLYPAADLLKALFNRRGDVDASLLSPADRRNLAQARLAEHSLRVKEGEYLPRDAYRAATSKAYATCAQSILSLPDNLERKLGLSPEQSEAAERVVDHILGTLSADLEATYRQAKAGG